MVSELIFVTGASGYLGAHVVHQLLESGYRVRGTARGSKIDIAKSAFAKYGSQFEVVDVNDIASDDIAVHLEGVSKVIHIAANLGSGRGDTETVLKTAIEGSLNVLRQSEKAGITKIVYCSSVVTATNPRGTYWNDDWNEATREQALAADPNDGFFIYCTAKTVAEREVWRFADAHKHIDITSINPPFIFGPLAPGIIFPTQDYLALSSTYQVYRFLFPNGGYPFMTGYLDVRDIARIHVAALTSPPEASVGRKRLVVSSPHHNDCKSILELIKAKRPQLASRVIDPSKAPNYPPMITDLKRVEEVTGVKADSYISLENTYLDTVDSLLVQENGWRAQGFTISIPDA